MEIQIQTSNSNSMEYKSYTVYDNQDFFDAYIQKRSLGGSPEDYFKLFKRAGFQMSELRESKPVKSNFTNIEEYERRSRIPLFMMFKLTSH